MRAIHKYKQAARAGNKEAQRRIAQSMGYKFSIYDMPHMVALLQRAGINMLEDVPKPLMADTDTITV